MSINCHHSLSQNNHGRNNGMVSESYTDPGLDQDELQKLQVLWLIFFLLSEELTPDL